MKNLNKNTKESIACLISSTDYPKFQLLANIAFEEGAGFVEIRIPYEVKSLNFEQFEKIKGKIILAIEPKNFQKEFSINQMKTIIDDMLIIKPFGIELHENLGDQLIYEILSEAKTKKIKVIISSYFDSFSSIKELKTKYIELSKFKADIIKLVVEIKDEFDAIELLKIHKGTDNINVIINPSGESAKLVQLLTPFYGSKFTYGYISQKLPEAQISLGYLLKSLEYFQQLI